MPVPRSVWSSCALHCHGVDVRRSFQAFGAVGIAVVGLFDPFVTTTTPPSPLRMSVVDEVAQAMPSDKAHRTPAEQKLDSHIIAGIEASRRHAHAAPDTLSRLPALASLEIDRDGRVHVDIQGTVTSGLLSAIGALRGKVESSFANYGTIRAWIPFAAAETLAARSDVRFIAPAAKGTTNSPDGD